VVHIVEVSNSNLRLQTAILGVNLYFSVHSGKCQHEQFISWRLELYTGIGEIQTKNTYISVFLLYRYEFKRKRIPKNVGRR